MIKPGDITVCMVHFNRPNLLKRSLPSYLNVGPIFVWDNNSIPNNKTLLRVMAARNSNIKPIWNNQNVGWPKAVNKMITLSETDWVLITAEDMVLGKDFFEKANQLLEWKPNLEQIYLHTFDAMLFHKKTFARMGLWDEEQPNKPPFWEDNDWYLRLVEHLGYSPYVYPGDHITGQERKKRLQYASTTELMERMDNFSYFSNCRWGISSINFDIKEISRDTSYIKTYNRNKGITAEQYYLKKWEETSVVGDLLNKDGTFWRRKKEDKVFYADIIDEYKNKYL